ncbi:hypothetical protein L1987_17379 [Smallanthus sonchifolius]|uniref:Uncharacterized protein n=1 Tax=Smallanthus sonchifolius TaxID=185202 RepID=A0ACB9J081_9ASTR|nr:hypothetical protein L1987_17379 [Smallanthus sonchifolius]
MISGFVTIRASKIYRIGLVHRSKQAISSSMAVRVFDFAGFAEYGWCIVVISCCAIVIFVDDLDELEHRVLRLTKENATLNRLQKVIMLSFKDHGGEQ